MAALCAGSASAQDVSVLVDSVVPQLLTQRQIPGAAVAVLKGGAVVHLRGYGYADLETKQAVTPHTVFQIGSLTKPFTAMVILKLVEDGQLRLDDRAQQHLDWLPAQYSGITLRQLLTHTSGVRRDLRTANVDEFPESEFRSRLQASDRSFAPGARWEYANTGYTLLALVAEAVTHKPLGLLFDELIFRRLGMRESGYRVPFTRQNHALGYDLVDHTLQVAPHIFSGWGNSGIESSASDLAAFAQSIERRSLLPPAFYDTLVRPANLASGTAVSFVFRGLPASYGLGWFLLDGRSAQHGGAIAGFQSSFERFTDGWTIIVLTNGKQGVDGQGQAEAIGEALQRAIRGPLTKRVIPPAQEARFALSPGRSTVRDPATVFVFW